MRPKLFAPALAVCALSALALALAAPPRQAAAAQGQHTVAGISQDKAAEMVEAMQGAWSLFDLRSPELPEAGRNMQGFLLVSDSYLALEIHLTWTSKQEGLVSEVFQSGIHRFTVDGLQVTLSSLIGAYNSEDDAMSLDYDPMHTERVYYIDIAEDLLTLSRGDGTRWVFSRLRDQQRQKTDFFGRPLPAGGDKEEGR